jgi:hypothetical protein
MIGSVNSNVARTAYAQAYTPVTKPSQVTKPEANETQAAEKQEPVTAQVREPESRQSAAALLKTLNTNETQNLPPTALQQANNAQANRATGLKAYSDAGKSQLNFA